MLEGRKISKRFGGLMALRDVDIDIEEGKIVGLIGPNGAGKTTLFNVISGFYRPDGGSIRFLGHDIAHLPRNRICRMGLTRTFQIVKPFSNMTVFENVLVGALNGIQKIADASEHAEKTLRLTGLWQRRDETAGNLTLSLRKRLEISRALATRPRLLFLDEVMAGLNPTEVKEAIDLIRKIREGGVTVLMVEHIMKAIMSLCDHIVVLHLGEKIAEGSPGEITSDMAVIHAYLGDDYVA